jgi:L-malate glycosyltransferase
VKIAVCGIAPKSFHYRTYSTYLAQCGHDVTAITNADAVDAPVRVVNFARTTAVSRALPRGTGWTQRAASIWRARHGHGFAVVNVQQMTPDGVIAALLWGGPLVLTFWGSDILLLHERPRWMRALMPVAVRKATLLHATSREIAERLVAMGADPGRIATFNYGVDLEVFRLREDEPEPGRILYTRRLTPLYRPDALLRAMPHVLAREPGARLTVAGRGVPGDLEGLQALAAELGLGDRVEFPGYVAKDEVADRLRRAELWVSIPRSDSLAISLQEAMACGPFPVVSDLPSMREALVEPHACFVNDVAPEQLADELAGAMMRARSGAHVRPNRAAVEELGDRRRNLARFEELLVTAARRRRPRGTPA